MPRAICNPSGNVPRKRTYELAPGQHVRVREGDLILLKPGDYVVSGTDRWGYARPLRRVRQPNRAQILLDLLDRERSRP